MTITKNARTGTIYHVMCLDNGKIYIGQTWRTIEERWAEHCLSDRCIKIHNAILKYGKHRFVVSPLTSGLTNQVDMDAAERYWIGYFNSVEEGYNLKYGGESGGKLSEESKAKLLGHSVSTEARAKMRAAKLGKKLTEEHKAKIGLAGKGKKRSEETRAKMREAQGHRSEETKAKLSASKKGHEVSEETRIKIGESLRKYFESKRAGEQ